MYSFNLSGGSSHRETNVARILSIKKDRIRSGDLKFRVYRPLALLWRGTVTSPRLVVEVHHVRMRSSTNLGNPGQTFQPSGQLRFLRRMVLGPPHLLRPSHPLPPDLGELPARSALSAHLSRLTRRGEHDPAMRAIPNLPGKNHLCNPTHGGILKKEPSQYHRRGLYSPTSPALGPASFAVPLSDTPSNPFLQAPPC